MYHNSNPESRKNVKNQTRMKCWKNWKEERDTDLRVLDEDDWRLIRVLMIEVNMITYEWNRDDLKEKESEIE